jgi:hypothetical protein
VESRFVRGCDAGDFTESEKGLPLLAMTLKPDFTQNAVSGLRVIQQGTVERCRLERSRWRGGRLWRVSMSC